MYLLLYPNCQYNPSTELNVQQLESKFTKIFGSFKKIYGTSMKDYITRHQYWFIYDFKCNVVKAVPQYKHRNKIKSKTQKQPSLETMSSTEVAENLHDGIDLVFNSPFSSSDVARGRRTMKGDGRPKADFTTCEGKSLVSKETLDSLMRRISNEQLIFIEDMNYYPVNPDQFMIDVASLWNTPNTTGAAYIVFGVSQNSFPPTMYMESKTMFAMSISRRCLMMIYSLTIQISST